MGSGQPYPKSAEIRLATELPEIDCRRLVGCTLKSVKQDTISRTLQVTKAPELHLKDLPLPACDDLFQRTRVVIEFMAARRGSLPNLTHWRRVWFLRMAAIGAAIAALLSVVWLHWVRPTLE